MSKALGITRHECKCYEHKDIIIPTKYVIDQQDIEKNQMFKTHKYKKIRLTRFARS